MPRHVDQSASRGLFADEGRNELVSRTHSMAGAAAVPLSRGRRFDYVGFASRKLARCAPRAAFLQPDRLVSVSPVRLRGDRAVVDG